MLTARPPPEEEARAPHHLFGVADAAEAWSVGRWLRAAKEALAAIREQGRLAIVVGGTGLYFKALTEGLAEVPAIPSQARADAQRLFDDLGEAAFRERLEGLDAMAAARITPGDRQRLTRSFEVVTATDRSLSDWQKSGGGDLARQDWSGVVLAPPRPDLYARIDARFDRMLVEGALEEVGALAARKLNPVLPAMKATGVRELMAYLRAERTLDDAAEAAKRETRRYAKRQMTWLRNQTPDWPRLHGLDLPDQWDELTSRGLA